MGDDQNDDAEAAKTLAIAVVKPAPLVHPIQAVIDSVNLAAVAIGAQNFAAGLALRGLAIGSGWIWNRYKYDRVKPALQAVAERLERTRSEYVRHEEFADVLQDALRRIGDQPDEERREALRSILLKIIETPQDHIANRRFLRLADELPVSAWRVLHAVEQTTVSSPGELIEGSVPILARAAGLSVEDFQDARDYLATEQLLNARHFNSSPSGAPRPGIFRYLLTKTGAAFLEYART